MHPRHRFARAAAVVLATTLAAAIAGVASAEPPALQAPAAATQPSVPLSAAEAARVFTPLVQSYFDAYARKDLDGMVALWHARGPARYRRNVVLLEFDLRRVELAALTVRNAGADAGGGRARAIVDLKVTQEKTGRTRRERRVRDFTFLQDDAGAWRIWNEVTPATDLARRLLAAPPAERDGLVAAEPELPSNDTLMGLSIEAGRLQGQRRFDEVLDALTTMTRLARSLGDADSLGRGLIQIGSMRMLAGKHADAAEAFEGAREAFVSEENSEEVAACDANLANLAYMQGRFADAAKRYQQAFDVFERQNDDPRMASVLHGLGNALYMQTEFARALEYYDRAVTILRRTRDGRGESAALQAIAMVHKELGDYTAAAGSWRKSLALAEAAGDTAGTANAWSGMGEIFRLQGDLVRSIEHHLKSLALWEQLKNAGAAATSRFAIGQAYALQRNFPRAVESYEKALELDRSIAGDPAAADAGQARDLGGLGGAHFAQGQPEVALPEYERSLALREKARDDVGVMWTLVHLGVLHASQHRVKEALAAYERALATAEAKSDAAAVSTILALRGQVEVEQGESDRALETTARAVDLATPIEHFDTVAFARLVAGRAHEKAGRAGDARTAYEDAVAAFAKAPLGPASETFFDNRRAPYAALVDLLAGQGNLADAFLWSEKARRRQLGDLLGGDGAVVVRGLTADERALERSAIRDLRTLAVKVRRERARQRPDAGRLASLQAEMASRQSDRDALRKRLYAAHPALQDLRAQSEPCGAEAASVLDSPSAALVSLVVGESRTWVFAVARGGADAGWSVQKAAAVEIKTPELAGRVRQFRDAIAKKDEAAIELGRDLHKLLLEPVQPVLSNKTRLVIVPDEFLWALPFEALPSASGRYLVEDSAVSYAPSLTSFVAVSRARPDATARRTLVAFGAPVLGGAVEERLALAMPQPASRQPADAEVRSLVALVGPARSRAYLGEQATTDRLAAGVAPGTLLHLAVPLVLTEATPLYSLVAFTPSDAADPATSLVEVASLMALDLPAEAAVASRVEYGPASGEGEAVTALAWSLFVAGTPTTVVDRWTVGPADASVLLRFYRSHIAPQAPAARQRRAAESLQRAMKGILAQPSTRHPFYWAGLMAVGR